MKYVIWVVGILATIFIVNIAILVIGAEGVVVVQLHASNQDGKMVTTRLWVVDDEGYQYLRSASGTKEWLGYVAEGREFTLTRNGETASYTAVQCPDKRVRINELMQEKYTWANSGLLRSTDGGVNAIPVELHPVQ
ncbi:MAG TPA: hypothetical protein DCM64_09895 [Gammaproteobacteria bacterium]|jgi:hypothetical protein|nr:hypothetical protein [Gammaproteobacteria bacterium]MDP6731325.1 hypothetical protein [Gammaproteobacteria bacterium]HAJ76753.1 hypothetical protein [Gammaproteobacteria bacterium]|tara:strand:- start:4253 stop:4660 length:408 start_codon:yes stop_codon:yes gene_type:complete